MKNNLKLATQIIPAVVLLLLAAFGLQHSAPTFSPVTTAKAASAEESVPATAPQKPEKRQKDATATETANQVTPGTGDYRDGTFTGTGNGFHGPVRVQVTVKDKQITDITILSNEDDPQFFNKAKEGVVSSILTAQTWEVDSVSGASYSSRGIKEAVLNALTGAKSTSSTAPTANARSNRKKPGSSSFKTPAGGYRDGTYYGTSNGFGGPVKTKVVIKNGKIASVTVVSAAKETGSYLKRAKGICKRIVSKQSPNVDTVSGATYSSTAIRRV